MAAGFADIMAAIGVWLGGRVSSTPAPSPSPSGTLHSGPGAYYGGRDDRRSTHPFDFRERATVEAVDRAIKHVLDQERAKQPRRRTEPVETPTAADLASAVDRLFTERTLADLAAAERDAARALVDAAMHEIAWGNLASDIAFLAAQEDARVMAAQDEADDEAALMSILRAVA